MKSRFRRSGRSLGIFAAAAVGRRNSRRLRVAAARHLQQRVSSSLGTVVFGTLPPVGTPPAAARSPRASSPARRRPTSSRSCPARNLGRARSRSSRELFMPLYAGPTGARPQVDYGAQRGRARPRSPTGTRRVTITIKPGLKWSNGAPIDANDVVFWFDLLKAAVKESPANWGQLHPRSDARQRHQRHRPRARHGRHAPEQALQPGLLPQQQPPGHQQRLTRCPARPGTSPRRAGRTCDYTNPANAKKIYDYLNKRGRVGLHASPPTRCGRTSRVRSSCKSFNATNSSYVLVPNPSYGGTPKPTARRRSTSRPTPASRPSSTR